MDRQPWHPSKDEVAHIREELRPLLTRMAEQEAAALAADLQRLDRSA